MIARGFKLTLGVLTGLLALTAAGAIAAFIFYLLAGDASPPAERHSVVTVQLLGSIGSVLAAALLAVLTWILVVLTREMSIASDQLSRVTQLQYEASGPAAQILGSKFFPVVDPADYANPDDPKDPPPSELEIRVRNVGGRPLAVIAIVIEAEWLQPLYADDDNQIVSMDTYTDETEISIDQADLIAGGPNPIPPHAEATWAKPDHGFELDGGLNGVRLGVRLQGGAVAWSPRARREEK